MQFKHPEILYFLVLLVIPVIVHLFQLQRFEKVYFTNVAFLKKITLQTRKSSRIKKWLILLTRLLSLLGLILAFAQPYFSNNKLDVKEHTVIYLDNSTSMNSKGEKGNLLQIAAQDIIENLPSKNTWSLLTNNNYYKNVKSDVLKSKLLTVKNTTKQTDLTDILLKIESENKKHPNERKHNILISDFQNVNKDNFTNLKNNLTLIKLNNQQKNNLAIDSVYFEQNSTLGITLYALIKNQGTAQKNIPIGIYNKDQLISKQTFNIKKNETKEVSFSLEKKDNLLGKLEITFEDSYNFDNTFYFTLNNNEKINILSIGNNNSFLEKIYTETEFNFNSSSLQKVNYNTISKQELIILNELTEIPQTLALSIHEFLDNGGNLIVIPNIKTDINSYTSFLKPLNLKNLNSKRNDTLKVTKIHYSHPLLTNVFNKKVNNFQYPKVLQNITSSFTNSSSILNLENNTPFVSEIKLKKSKFYWFSAPINKTNSNFANSPLIVPVFYNIGQQSLKLSKLFYRLSTKNSIDINTKLNKDGVLSLSSKKESFVPIQQTHQNKVTITTTDQPKHTGFYDVKKQDTNLIALAFNTPKAESNLSFLDLNSLKNEKNINVKNSVKDTLNQIDQSNKVHWLWKWFLILAIVSLLLEILILKFFKI